MHQGLKLVEADRASLFLVDQKTMQLYARIFGVTGEMDGEEIRQVDAAAQGKLRFPLDKGLAGYVATRGKAVIVQDCSKVHTNVCCLGNPCLRIRGSLLRLTRRPDTRQGDQSSHCQLCPGLSSVSPSPSVAVSSQFYRWKLWKNTFSVLGAQQEDGGGRIYAGRPRHISSSIDLKVHKREAFNTLQVFASYIGLALHHAKLYDKIKKNEQKYKVVQEVVNYQSTAPQHEVQEVKPPKRLWE